MQLCMHLSVDRTRIDQPPEKPHHKLVARSSRREFRCEKHGFICDPKPGNGAQWLCPHCPCPWPLRRVYQVPGTVNRNSGAVAIVREALKRDPGSLEELSQFIGGIFTAKQLRTALCYLKSVGEIESQTPWIKRKNS